MENQNIQKQISNYIMELKAELHHPLLKRDLGEIDVKESAAFFLLLPLLNNEKWSATANTAAIAVGAVHAAFDAHDDIHSVDASATEQQLTVLSGDYFSGVHYRLLASLPDFHFVAVLSTIIGQINETKTNFHYQSPKNVAELIQAVRTIEVSCITEFFHSYGFSNYAPLVSVAYPLLILENLERHDKIQPSYIASEWQLQDELIHEAVMKLRQETLQMIDEAYFLLPMLKEEMKSRTLPLLGKSI